MTEGFAPDQEIVGTVAGLEPPDRQPVTARLVGAGSLPATASGASPNPRPESDPVPNDPLLHEVVRRLVTAYEPERLYLFGSHARGDAGPDSDYDVLIVVSETAPPDRRSSRLAHEALRGVGTAVDAVVMTGEYFDWMLGAAASLPATVAREGRLLHAA